MPFITVKDGFVTDANSLFLELSCYEREAFIGKSLSYVWKILLRITVEPIFIDGYQEAYLVTNSLETIHVKIKTEIHNKSNCIVYNFFEIQDSMLGSRFLFIDRLYSMGKIGVAIYSAPDLILLKANSKYLNSLDKPYDEARNSIGKNVAEIISGFGGSSIEEKWHELVETGEILDVREMPYEGYNRGTTYWDMMLVPILEDGVTKYLVHTTDDVTQCIQSRKKVEAQNEIIKQQKEQLEIVIDNISDGLCVVDKKGNFIKVNSAFQEFMIKHHKLDNIPKRVENAIKCGMNFYDENGKPLMPEALPMNKVLHGERIEKQKIIFKGENGESIIETSATPVFDEEGELLYGILLGHDITHVMENKRLLNEQKEYLEAVIENFSDAIFVYDKENNLYIQNRSARDYFSGMELKHDGGGFDHIKYYNMHNREIPYEEMPIFKVQRGQIIKNEMIKMVQGDNVRYMYVSGMPVYNSDNSMKLYIIHSRDITEHVQKETIIKQQQELLLKREREKGEALKASMDLKDEFLYLITHEFRTPMAVINSAIQAVELMCREEVTERLGHYLKIIKQNNKRQLRLVNNLLDITRISSGNIRMNYSSFEIVHVVQMIVNSVQLYGQQKRVKLGFESTLKVKKIYSDEEKIERILLNLLSNALKFTPGDKSINVTLSERVHKNRNMISISVKDEGIGIPEEKRDIIFERFGQVDSSLSRRAEGTGLGLYLTKLLIDSLEGEVLLESEIDKGSNFTVLLPVCSKCGSIEKAEDSEADSRMLKKSDRIIESVGIEFSDIYF